MLTCFLIIIVLFPICLQTEHVSLQAQKYMKIFDIAFPNIDIKSATVYDFVKNETNINRVIYFNTKSCIDARLHLENLRKNGHRVTRSVYKLMAPPLDLEETTPSPNTDPMDPEHYLDIKESDYNKFTLTNSEKALSQEGWDYSPFVADPKQTTTEFIWPSWNYEGRVPYAFFKEYTKGEQDPKDQSPLEIPDDINGYTEEGTNTTDIKTFDQAFNTFWDTIFSIKDYCDNYTSYFACMQGKEIRAPNLWDPNDEWVD